jgi:rhodanese-related sulfurtransferase
MLTITPTELSSLLKESSETLDLIDVRTSEEFSELRLREARNIPLHLIPMRMSEIDRTKKIICICRSGARSGQTCSYLEGEGIPSYNLVGGMIEFEKRFPHEVIYDNKNHA